MKKNNKGFTLIELLAVVAILAIVAVLAYNQIANRTSKSKISTIKVNADRYIKAVNDMATMSIKEDVDYEEGTYTVTDLQSTGKIKTTGTLPTGGYVVISNYEVVDACLMYENKYAVKFENAVAKTVEENSSCENSSLSPSAFDVTFPGYTKTEYIESTGTQYIDTGYIPKTNTKIELEVSFNDTFKNYSSYGGSNCFMGVVDSNSKWFSFNFGDEANQSNQFYSWVDTSSQSTVDITLTDDIRTTKNTFTVQNGTISYATINKSIAAKSNNQDTSMYLFASNAKEYDYNTPFTSYNMRVYGLKIYEGTSLVRELIPCYNNSSIGLCDTKTALFYGNSGTGTFNKGSDVI